MPIKPENKKLYPKNWKQIRQDILARANNKCEFCGVANKSVIIYKNKEIDGIYSPDDFIYHAMASIGKNWISADRKGEICSYRKALVVLTIAHVDQDPTNNDYSNLKALCQKCHNRLDMPFRVAHRKNKT